MDPTLPGYEIVEAGLRDLEARRETTESLLVSMAVERLAQLGVAVPPPLPDPETTLYRRLSEQHGDGAHSKYNAYRRRLASFLRALSCVSRSTPSASEPS